VFAPVHRLTEESLAHIFQLVASECHARRYQNWATCYGWIAITHVCRYWQRVAISFPSTWSIIDSNNPAIARLCLKRSKKSSIDVRLRAGCPEKFFRELQPHISRTMSLSCNLTGEEENQLYSYLMDEPAPRLFRFSVQGFAPRSSPLPQLFQSQSTSLRYLRLCSTSLDRAWGHLTTLTVLEIFDSFQFANGVLDVNNFLDFLQRNILLEQITISFPSSQADEGDPNRLVSLPHLRVLTLSGSASKKLLSHIEIPHGADLIIIPL
jgi:hypothetical protein